MTSWLCDVGSPGREVSQCFICTIYSQNSEWVILGQFDLYTVFFQLYPNLLQNVILNRVFVQLFSHIPKVRPKCSTEVILLVLELPYVPQLTL